MNKHDLFNVILVISPIYLSVFMTVKKTCDGQIIGVKLNDDFWGQINWQNIWIKNLNKSMKILSKLLLNFLHKL